MCPGKASLICVDVPEVGSDLAEDTRRNRATYLKIFKDKAKTAFWQNSVKIHEPNLKLQGLRLLSCMNIMKQLIFLT